MQPSRTIVKGVALVNALILVAGLVSNYAGIWRISTAVPLAISALRDQEQTLDLGRSEAESVETRVFTLIDANAELVVNELTTLFGTEIQSSKADANQVTASGRDLYSLKFAVDKQQNAVTASGKREELQMVEALIRRLDGSDLTERRHAAIRLHSQRATKIEESITQFIESQREIAEGVPDLIAFVKALEKEVIVVADPTNNCLMISTSLRYFENIKSMILKIDNPPPQAPQEHDPSRRTMIGGTKSAILFSPASASGK